VSGKDLGVEAGEDLIAGLPTRLAARLAVWATLSKSSMTGNDGLFAILRASGVEELNDLGFRTSAQLNHLVESVVQIPWRCKYIRIRGIRGIPAGTMPPVPLWYRDPLLVLLKMFRDPFWQGHTRFDYEYKVCV
jgi:hypothetical protein